MVDELFLERGVNLGKLRSQIILLTNVVAEVEEFEIGLLYFGSEARSNPGNSPFRPGSIVCSLPFRNPMLPHSSKIMVRSGMLFLPDESMCGMRDIPRTGFFPLRFWNRDRSGVQQGGKDVAMHHLTTGDHALRQSAFPVHEERHVQPALIGGGFSTAERTVVSGKSAAGGAFLHGAAPVVTDEDDESVLSAMPNSSNRSTKRPML